MQRLLHVRRKSKNVFLSFPEVTRERSRTLVCISSFLWNALWPFEDVVSRFLHQYKHQTDHLPSLVELMNLTQNPDESVVSFIDRWKSLASRATFMIPEGDAVCIAFSNIRGQECYRVRRLSNLPRPRWTCSLHGKRNQGQNYNLIYQSKAPRTESKKTRIKKNTATGQYITVHYYSSETHDRRESSGEELWKETATGNSAGKATRQDHQLLFPLYMAPKPFAYRYSVWNEKQALPYRTIGSIIGAARDARLELAGSS